MAQRTRLWVVSELYYPEETSTGYFLTRIAEGLAGDYAVEVIAAQPSYSERGIEAAADEDRNGTRIHRVRSTHFNKDMLPLRVINVITFALAVAFFAWRRLRPGDLLLVVTNPPTLPPILAFLARRRRVTSFLLVHDVYPEVLAAVGMVRLEGPIGRLLSLFFNRTLAWFDHILVIGRDMQALIETKLGPHRAVPISLIPNWGDPEEIAPIARGANRFAREHGLTGKYVVQFSGNIGRTHDIEAILALALRLRDDPDLLFLFVGYGGKTAHVTRFRETHGLANIVLLPRQPRARLGEMLACADVTIVSLDRAMLGISVPSRMYNIMAAGIPILAIAHPQSELARCIEENDAGWTGTGETEALVRLLDSARTPEGARDAQARGANGRAAVIRRYTFPAVLAQFRAALATGASA